METRRDCAWESCDRPRRKGRSVQYCNAHYIRHMRGADMAVPLRTVRPRAMRPDVCEFEGCAADYYSAGMCRLHYGRRYHGLEMVGPNRKQPRISGVSEKPGPNGYMLTWIPEHPAAASSGHVLTHRLVMEKQLGRYLLPGENVHHKNGQRDDNRPENLELWVSSQPAGQRPEDLVAWAHEILRRHG